MNKWISQMNLLDKYQKKKDFNNSNLILHNLFHQNGLNHLSQIKIPNSEHLLKHNHMMNKLNKWKILWKRLKMRIDIELDGLKNFHFSLNNRNLKFKKAIEIFKLKDLIQVKEDRNHFIIYKVNCIMKSSWKDFMIH
jgi:hypothetical protein